MIAVEETGGNFVVVADALVFADEVGVFLVPEEDEIGPPTSFNDVVEEDFLMKLPLVVTLAPVPDADPCCCC